MGNRELAFHELENVVEPNPNFYKASYHLYSACDYFLSVKIMNTT